MRRMQAPASHAASPALNAPRTALWHEAWQALGVAQPDAALLAALEARYREPHRHYHTLEHLDACLRHFVSARTLAEHPHEIVLALWFHDAVYAIRAPDNERLSADWAREALTTAGVDAEVAGRVHALVMVTRHDVAPATVDQQLLLDADLSILGARAAVFDAYEQQVFAEYAAVPRDAFRANRRRILQGFLDRPRIYHTAQFHDRLEAQARANLARSIRQLAA